MSLDAIVNAWIRASFGVVAPKSKFNMFVAKFCAQFMISDKVQVRFLDNSKDLWATMNSLNGEEYLTCE